MAELIDTHAHLQDFIAAGELEGVLARSAQAEVVQVIGIGVNAEESEQVVAIADENAGVFAAVGFQPNHLLELKDGDWERIVALAGAKTTVAIGETGLDFHYDLSPRDIQAKVFRVHIAAARATGLPLVVHTREADAEMGDILEEEFARGPFRMLMHCYTSGPELAARAAALGAWFSVSGIATFKTAEDVRALVRAMPEDRIIVETDCPYLAPVPHRGRRNEPAYLPAVLAKTADLRGWSLEEAEAKTEAAFFALFDRIPRPFP